MAPQPTRLRKVQDDIEYAIVALQLSAPEIAAIVKAATGVNADPRESKFLQSLDGPQLEATWECLSENPGWQRAKSHFSGAGS